MEIIKSNLNNIEESFKKSVELESKPKEAEAVPCIKSNPKYFYKNVKTRVSPLKDHDNQVNGDPGEIAETLNQCYQSVLINPVDENVINTPIDFLSEKMSPTKFCEI